MPGPRIPGAEFQKAGFIFQRDSFRVGITQQTLQVFIGQRLDGRFLRFPDPGNLDLHKKNLTTKDTQSRKGIRRGAGYARFFFRPRTGARFCRRPSLSKSDGSIRLADFHNLSRS